MAWMCQLAYETADPGKIRSIASDWSITIPQAGIIVQPVATILPMSDTRLVVGVRDGVAIIAFAGTDPVSIANWITDFDIAHDAQGAANGFASAARSVRDRL